jgi:hypothetical protein
VLLNIGAKLKMADTQISTDTDYNYLLIKEQIPFIEQIIKDECWYEAERRNEAVTANDPVILTKICDIVLRVGAEMRMKAEMQLSAKFL